MSTSSMHLSSLPSQSLNAAGAYDNGDAVVKLRAKLTDIIQAPIPPNRQVNLQGIFTYFPDLAASLPRFQYEDPRVISALRDCPEASLVSFVRNRLWKMEDWYVTCEHKPQLLALVLEDAILRDGAVLEQYLDFQKKHQLPLLRHKSIYRDRLLRDPICGCRWARANNDTLFLTDAVKYAQKNAQSYGSAAWILCAAGMASLSELVPFIAMDIKYAIATSVAWGYKFYLEDFEGNLHPQQIFWLLENKAVHESENVEDTLYTRDSVWGCEWLLRKGPPYQIREVQLILESNERERSSSVAEVLSEIGTNALNLVVDHSRIQSSEGGEN